MKKTILLSFLFIVHVFVSGQQRIINADSIVKLLSGKTGCGMPSQSKEKEYKLGLFSCLKTKNDTPFYVVDGVPESESEVKKINPDNIASIDILKPSGVKLFCSSPTPIIVIVTKNLNQRTIIIKDTDTGQPLSAASVELIPAETGTEKACLIADSAGRVITDKVKSGKVYQLRVSNVGYNSFTAAVNTKVLQTNYTVLLQKNPHKLTEVIVVSGGRRTISCCIGIVCSKTYAEEKTKGESRDQATLIKVYPNPVQRSQNINFELNAKDHGKITVRLISPDGKLVSSAQYCSDIGLNRFSYPITSSTAAGIYSFQLTNHNGHLIKTEKLIVQ